MNFLQLINPHAGGQRAIYSHPARYHIVACGRRFGKTEFGKLVAYKTLFDLKQDVWWVSPTYKMSSAIWRDFKKTIGQYATWISAAERTMEFPDGQKLIIWTGQDADTMRGGAPGIAIVDEAAMIADPDMWPAVIRPALTDKRGKALFLSTPKGRNWFWNLFVMGQDPEEPDYKSWQFPSWNNPYLPRSEFADAERTLPERFYRQEYAAEFIADAGGVFRGVMAVSTGEICEPYYNDHFVMGIDWAKDNDFTVLSVIDVQRRKQVDIDRFNKIGWGVQRDRVVTMQNKWNCRTIWAEENSIGSVNIEALQDLGLPVQPFYTSLQSKGPLIDGLALAIERLEIELLNDRIQIAELQAYEMERLPSGRFRYGAPPGMHDDTVIATALAWHGATHGILTMMDNPFEGYRG